jgi:DNA-directed RNA polymerase alpha subunit
MSKELDDLRAVAEHAIAERDDLRARVAQLEAERDRLRGDCEEAWKHVDLMRRHDEQLLAQSEKYRAQRDSWKQACVDRRWAVLVDSLPNRARNILARAGIDSMEALLTRSAFYLLSLRGFGETSLGHVEQALARHGLALRGEEPEASPPGLDRPGTG